MLSTGIHLRFLPPHSMMEEEKKLLVSIVRWDYDARSAADIVRIALEGHLALWRMEGLVRGLLITRILDSKKGRILFIDGFGGEGVVEHREAMLRELESLAMRAKATHLSGLVSRPGMKWLVEEVGLPLVAHIFVKRLEHAET